MKVKEELGNNRTLQQQNHFSRGKENQGRLSWSVPSTSVTANLPCSDLTFDLQTQSLGSISESFCGTLSGLTPQSSGGLGLDILNLFNITSYLTSVWRLLLCS